MTYLLLRWVVSWLPLVFWIITSNHSLFLRTILLNQRQLVRLQLHKSLIKTVFNWLAVFLLENHLLQQFESIVCSPVVDRSFNFLLPLLLHVLKNNSSVQFFLLIQRLMPLLYSEFLFCLVQNSLPHERLVVHCRLA